MQFKQKRIKVNTALICHSYFFLANPAKTEHYYYLKSQKTSEDCLASLYLFAALSTLQCVNTGIVQILFSWCVPTVRWDMFQAELHNLESTTDKIITFV